MKSVSRPLAVAAVIFGTLTGGLAIAGPAQAFPRNCTVSTIYEDGVAIGGQTRCLSGTGQHRVGIHCSNGRDYYGEWKNTGSIVTRISRRECPAGVGVVLSYRWLETRG
jgi:hypothetical protein